MTEPAARTEHAPPRWARWAWAVVLVAGVLAYLLVLRTLVATQNPNFIPTLILLGSAVVPASVLSYAVWGGKGPAVPAGLVTITAVVGGVLGTVAAGTVEYDVLHRLGTIPMLVVGLAEETSKLIVPVAVLLLTRLRDPRAGVVIGVASGMGFATLETMGYGFSTLLKTPSVAALDDTLLLRALLSPAGHVAWTGLTVAAIWAIPLAAHRGRAILRALGVFVAAVALHAAWDGINTLLAHVIVGGVSFVALMMVIRRSHRSTPLSPRSTRAGRHGPEVASPPGR